MAVDSMFPHTVTLFNVLRTTDPGTFRDAETTMVNATILKGVLLDESKAVNVRTGGKDGADAVTLYIPCGVEAIGADGSPKTYAAPKAYRLEMDVSGLWTLAFKEPDFHTFFVKGDRSMESGIFENINEKHDGAYAVTGVDEFDYGGLPHWEVGGA